MTSQTGREVAFGRRAPKAFPSEAQPIGKPLAEGAQFGRRAMKVSPTAAPTVSYAPQGTSLEDKGSVPAGYQPSYGQTLIPDRRRGSSSESLGGPIGTELLRLTFGDNRRCPDGWLQGFRFNSEGPRYCLVQEKGGPCGVLAVVMAFIVKNILGTGRDDASTELPKARLLEDLLKDALSEILWRIAGGSGGNIHLVSGLDDVERPDRASVSTYDSKEAALAALKSPPLLRQYTQCSGLVAFVYSAILTRGLKEVREDTDDPKGVTMLGAHGYCTQELVNLLLVGRAVSNTFDGKRFLEGLLLKGIECASCPIGLLSLYEHFGCLEVGQRLKMPSSAIWLICAESHYSLLYAVGPIDTDTVKLRYMDQLMAEEGEYDLTLRLLKRKADVTPPRGMIEQCIRTRWPDYDISWNGRDPIL